jgi:DNA-binding NarL/FixJ family response regulator
MNGSVVRVFIVDDHAMVRDSVRLACEGRPGMEVVGEAGDGGEAVVAIAHARPDVVVLDLILPTVSGFDVVHRLHEESFPGKVLILTARDDEDALMVALMLGVDGFLTKSATLDQIGDAIQTVADGGTAFDEGAYALAASRIGRFARRARGRAAVAEALTPREREVLGLLAEGQTCSEIALRLGVARRTIESHVGSIYSKLGVRTRAQAVYRALSLGLVEPPGLEESGESRPLEMGAAS